MSNVCQNVDKYISPLGAMASAPTLRSARLQEARLQLELLTREQVKGLQVEPKQLERPMLVRWKLLPELWLELERLAQLGQLATLGLERLEAAELLVVLVLGSGVGICGPRVHTSAAWPLP